MFVNFRVMVCRWVRNFRGLMRFKENHRIIFELLGGEILSKQVIYAKI